MNFPVPSMDILSPREHMDFFVFALFEETLMFCHLCSLTVVIQKDLTFYSCQDLIDISWFI